MGDYDYRKGGMSAMIMTVLSLLSSQLIVIMITMIMNMIDTECCRLRDDGDDYSDLAGDQDQDWAAHEL